MSEMNVGRKTWTREVIELLDDLSSERIHSEGWLRGVTEYVYSWSDFVVEFLNVHLTDYFLSKEMEEMGFSDSIREALAALRRELSDIVDKYGVDDSRVAEVISDPDFQRTARHAAQVREMFRLEGGRLGLTNSDGD